MRPLLRFVAVFTLTCARLSCTENVFLGKELDPAGVCAGLPSTKAVLGQFDHRGCCGECCGETALSPDVAPPAASIVSRLLLFGRRVVLIGDSLTLQLFDALRVEAALESLALKFEEYGCALVNASDSNAVEQACPLGTRRVRSCADVDSCHSVQSVELVGVERPATLVVVLVTFFLYQLPASFFSTSALDALRREWPDYNRQLAHGTRHFQPLLLTPFFEGWLEWADIAVCNAGAHYDFVPVEFFSATVRGRRCVV